MIHTQNIHIGCAGWQIPRALAERFPAEGTHLQRYSARFRAVEINTTFHKPHRPTTYESWASSVPDGFHFAVKMPKQVTHFSKLADLATLGYFLDDIGPLGDRMGPLLVQLPPNLAFDAARVRPFLVTLRFRFKGSVVCEPRHVSWFTAEADGILAEFRVARVAADPAPVPAAAEPGGWNGLAYYRLHGAPRIYYSSYTVVYLDNLAQVLRHQAASRPTWCIFDNTALGAATENALALLERLDTNQGDPHTETDPERQTHPHESTNETTDGRR